MCLSGRLIDPGAVEGKIANQGTCNGGKTVNCSFGSIVSGGSVTVTIQVNRVKTKVPVTDTVSVSSSVFDIDMIDNSATVTIP